MNNFLTHTFVLFGLFFFDIDLSQGQNTVSGVVVDKRTDESIPGVSIFEKGTSTGTITDSDGRFQLNLSDDCATLVFQNVGYKNKEVFVCKGSYFLEIKIKVSCHRDFFDHTKVEIGLLSGVLKNPLGASLMVSLPLPLLHKIPGFSQTPLRTEIAYQTDLDQNSILKARFGLVHMFVTCDKDIDINFYYRDIESKKGFDFKSYFFEGKLFWNELLFFGGYGFSDKVNTESLSEKNLGYGLGLGTYIRHPLHLMISGKTIYWGDFWEFQAGLNRGFKQFEVGLLFTKIEGF